VKPERDTLLFLQAIFGTTIMTLAVYIYMFAEPLLHILDVMINDKKGKSQNQIKILAHNPFLLY